MKIHKYTERELKLTAILYATRGNIVAYVIARRKLLAKIRFRGFPCTTYFILHNQNLDSLFALNGHLDSKSLKAESGRKGF